MLISKNISTHAKKAASATVLSFLGSSFILSIAVFLVKDTVERVNNTVTNVNKHNEQMISLDGSIISLNEKIDTLNISVNKTSGVLDEYTKNHAKNLSNMTVSMVRVTEKLISLDKRCDHRDVDIAECERKIEKIMDRK